MSLPLCARCKHGIVQELKSNKGLQDPETKVYCTKMMERVSPELSWCSQLSPFISDVHPADVHPDPVYVRVGATRRHIADVLYSILQLNVLQK